MKTKEEKINIANKIIDRLESDMSEFICTAFANINETMTHPNDEEIMEEEFIELYNLIMNVGAYLRKINGKNTVFRFGDAWNLYPIDDDRWNNRATCIKYKVKKLNELIEKL